MSDSDDDIPLAALHTKTKKSAAKKPAARKPAAKKPAAKRAPASKRSPAKKPAAKKPAAKKPAAKKPAAKKPAAAATKKRARATSSAPPAKKTRKKLTENELMDGAMKAYLWWNARKLPEGVNWTRLEHCGVVFPEEYVPHGVKMLYDGEPVELTPDQEEIATMYASVPLDGPYLGDAKNGPQFKKNFFADFRRILGADHVIEDLDKCDFEPIRELLAARKEEKKLATKEDKAAAKAVKDAAIRKHGYAVLDGDRIERLGNYTVEPPNLFRGRGFHPKMGTLKQRLMPEDIAINLSKDAVVPPCPIPGHNWRRVVHNPRVTWLSNWKENIKDNQKYVQLAASSSFKGKSDRDKYEKARRLCLYIDTIRKIYNAKLKNSDPQTRQIGTCMWIIDRLALRVGGEKDDDEADTVGCCSLRVQHLTFVGDNQCEFKFLGKDSMLYHETIDFGKYDAGALVLKNLQSFCSKRGPEEDVFDKVTPTILNSALKEAMPGLTAKVFRTYNASVTLEQELAKLTVTEATADNQKKALYDSCNREVAILCNHQRTVPKGFKAAFEKLEAKDDLYSKQLAELRKMVKAVKAGKEVRTKTEDADKETKAQETHLFARQPTEEQLQKKISTIEARQVAHQVNMKNKDDNKDVALGTSKINYMDPRISVAWCKAVECPIDKVFAKALREKFPWAMSVDHSWRFVITEESQLEENVTAAAFAAADAAGAGAGADDDDDDAFE